MFFSTMDCVLSWTGDGNLTTPNNLGYMRPGIQAGSAVPKQIGVIPVLQMQMLQQSKPDLRLIHVASFADGSKFQACDESFKDMHGGKTELAPFRKRMEASAQFGFTVLSSHPASLALPPAGEVINIKFAISRMSFVCLTYYWAAY